MRWIDRPQPTEKLKAFFRAVWSQDFQHQAMTIFSNNCGNNRDWIPNNKVRCSQADVFLRVCLFFYTDLELEFNTAKFIF